MHGLAQILHSLLAGRKKPLLVCVEGNIGVGKSTAISALQQCLTDRGYTVDVQLEKTTRWIDLQIFEDMYRERTSASTLAFQLLGPFYDALDRLHAYQNSTADVVIWERHVHTILDVFGVSGTVQSYPGPQIRPAIHQAMAELIAKLDRLANGQILMRPDVLLYLVAPPSVCEQRVFDRERCGEKAVTLDVLETLHRAHESFIDAYPTEKTNIAKISSQCAVHELAYDAADIVESAL